MYKTISTHELQHMMLSDNTKLIDLRPVDAYNGWKLEGEARGGHIRGAISLPRKWSSYIDWIEIVRSKDIHPANEIIIYGCSLEEAEKVSAMFNTAGYEKIQIYRHFTDEWTVNKELPMDHLARYRNLVSANWVNELISGKNPETYKGQKYVICHAHYRNRHAYLSGHIPGAIDMDTLALEDPGTWNRRTPAELEKALLEHGITSDTLVILYGKYMFPRNEDPFPGSAAGDIGAMRCAFIMMYAGVKDVRILNGGFQSWFDASYEVETTDIPKKPETEFGIPIPAHPELAVDMEEAKQLLASEHGDLISVRSWPEYIGEVSGYNYIEKKGRIPGAIFGNCGSDAYHMENYRNVDHTMRAFHETQQIWNEAGITPEKRLAFYCGTGWRGSEAFLNAWLMGYPNVAVFDGGWFEWSNNPDNPYETGIPIALKNQIMPQSAV
jgi:thiosulfate/3-mercaptopyruvate sulfurtransferase